MPKLPTNYQNTVIYKIQHIEKDELIYIGHTTSFTKRKSQHKQRCCYEKGARYHFKVYKMIRDNGGWNSFIMIELYKFPCHDAREAACEEDKVMREYKSCMNSARAYTTPDEKRTYNIIYNHGYRQKNNDILSEQKKTYYKDNKEAMTEKNRRYRNVNSEEIKAKKLLKFNCECGGKYAHCQKQRHFRTARHIKFLEN